MIYVYLHGSAFESMNKEDVRRREIMRNCTTPIFILVLGMIEFRFSFAWIKFAT